MAPILPRSIGTLVAGAALLVTSAGPGIAGATGAGQIDVDLPAVNSAIENGTPV
ncbi:MAG: hypothetical protein QOF51_1855, partial [Chloroflexota bacterium]|nr:hypothetical protein [Chloroflexota bacterium]